MTDWIDFAVYVAFLVAVWFVQPTWQQKLAIPMLTDRNAAWMAAHPDVVRKVERRRWNLWLGYLLGAISIGVLTSFQFGLWTPPPPRNGAPLLTWMVLWDLTMASMIVALVVGGSIGLVGYFRMKKYIPIAERRQATLERRSLDDFVLRWVQLATYALVIADLIAWVTAAVLGTHSSPVFWSRLVIMFVLSGFFYIATVANVARRPNVMDRICGPTYRRREVRLVFATQITTPIVGALRLYEEVNSTFVFDASRALQLGLALFITCWMLWMALLPIDTGGRRTGPRPVPFAPLSS